MFVVTFYSFKGGVGRTMALVNVAIELAQRGRRVLIVDFDLEAPGLGTFDIASNADEIPGVVDYVTDYLASDYAPDVTDFICRCDNIQEKKMDIWLMSAGRQDQSYGHRLHSIDWNDLYENHSGYLLFEELKVQWEKKIQPDYVLIDSRTGHTDVSGICTRQLPDSVAVMFFPNKQNLSGLYKVVKDIRSEKESAQQKNINLHFVASNVPDLDDEFSILKRQLQTFRQGLEYEKSVKIQHYNSMDLVDQKIFVAERPRSRLARQYNELVQEIIRENPADKEGALDYLREVVRVTRERRQYFYSRPKELEDRLEKIQAEHPKDGEILAQLSEFRERQGSSVEALELLNTALKNEYRTAEVYRRRASIHRQMNENEAAIRDLQNMLCQDDATYFDVSLAIKWISELDVGKMDTAIKSPAVHDLDFYEKYQLVEEVLRARRDRLGYALVLLSQMEDDKNIGEDLRSFVRSGQVLALIGLGEFHRAMEVTGDRSRILGDLDISRVFNYAFAEWGAVGTPPLDLFHKIVDLDERQSRQNPLPNYYQCLGIAHWVTGNTGEAMKKIQLSRKLINEKPGTAFSAWRYLNVKRLEFLKDLSMIEKMVEGDDIQPEVFQIRREEVRMP